MNDPEENVKIKFSLIDVLKMINSVQRYKSEMNSSMIEHDYGRWMTYTDAINAMHKMSENKQHKEN